MTRVGAGCQYVRGDLRDCNDPSTLAVGVRAHLSDSWQEWPVCDRHVRALVHDVSGFFLVTEPYRIGDGAARSIARAVADSLDGAA